MREFDRHKSRDRVIFGFVLRGLGVAALFFFAVVSVKGAWGMYTKFTEALDGEHVAKSDLAALQTQETQVNAAVASLSTERGVEAQVRERYGVVKPGEGEIRVVRDSTSTDIVLPAQQENVFLRVIKALFVW